MKDRKSDLRYWGLLGFWMGSREMGGAPKVMQWMRLKPRYVNGDFSKTGYGMMGSYSLSRC